MNKIIYIISATLLLLTGSCSDKFLDEDPIGEISPDQALVEENLEKVIISAYSVLNGQLDEKGSAFNSPASNWSFGDVVSDDAYKGGGGTGDQNQIHLMEIYAHDESILDVERKWLALYEGISRANIAIRLLNTTEDMETELKTQRIAEMRFLRGHFHFEAKKIYGNICIVDENIDTMEEFYALANSDYSDTEQWAKIEEDFEFAINNLPLIQSEIGRPITMAAQAYLTKCLVFQQKWEEVISSADKVISSGQYELHPDFREVFEPDNDNGTEIIFAVQNSINDGSPKNYNGSIGDRLMPPSGPYPDYGFLRPSQNLVNAFKTDLNGLPLHDGIDLTDDDIVDPRIDHTLARPGIPFFDIGIYDWEPRDETTYGPYSPKKRLLSVNSSQYLAVWPYVTSVNYYIIRYADLLLWRAEAAIETGDLEGGRMYINLIRQRAKDSQYVQTEDETANASNYLINTYDSAFASQEEAKTALQTERRLEFAHEGHRFFDLVRWGIAGEVMNAYFTSEKELRSHLVNANFVVGKHEYQPIPQSQMDLCQGEMIQNPNY